MLHLNTLKKNKKKKEKIKNGWKNKQVYKVLWIWSLYDNKLIEKKVKRQTLQRHGYIQHLFFGCRMIYYNNVTIGNEMI